MVLEVGAGEGVLTERLAARAAHVHTVEIDRGLEAALAPVAALPNVTLHWGDSLQIDLLSIAPPPDAMVANLPYSVATPTILRTINELPSIRTWTVMVQLEIADRLRAGPPRPRLRGTVRDRPGRLRGRTAPQGRPRRLQAAPARRLGDPAPAADRPGPTCRPAS